MTIWIDAVPATFGEAGSASSTGGEEHFKAKASGPQTAAPLSGNKLI
jgi:hypothetical protein